LLYYSNLGIEYPYFVFENKEELLKEIIKWIILTLKKWRIAKPSVLCTTYPWTER
jgi:hypothetical protein